MIDFKRVVKTGVVSGIINGIISAIPLTIMIIFLTDTYPSVYEMGTYQNGFLIILIIYLVTTGIGILIGLVTVTIFTSIYAIIYKWIPGSTSVIKGIILALIAWLILSVGFGYTELISSMQNYLANISVRLITWLVVGILVGIFWDKFKTDISLKKISIIT